MKKAKQAVASGRDGPGSGAHSQAPRESTPLPKPSRFERLLWSSRWLVVAAVLASVAMALGALYMGTVDVAYLLRHLVVYASPELSTELRNSLREEMITAIVKAADSFLVATILIVFGLGLYELFVSPLDPAQNASASPRLLQIHSLDDLKGRLAKMIILLLVVDFFEHAFILRVERALDLLYLALGILLVSAAVFVSALHPAAPE